MASNFWQSSHFQRWIFTREETAKIRQGIYDKVKYPTEKELLLQGHFVRHIQSIGRKLRYKQVVVATATTFFKRFFLHASVFEHDPRVVAPTVLYLAVKVEEMGQLRPDYIVNESNARIETLKLKPADIYACEIIVLEKLKFDLVLFHPYHDLEKIVMDATQDTANVFSNAWCIVNDSQRSDCSLTYPPSIIALAALYIAGVQANLDLKPWFDELNLNLEQVRECASDIVDASRQDQERPMKIEGVLAELVDFWKHTRNSAST